MAKRSQFPVHKAIGPGVIDQLSYLDRAKAKLQVGNIIPVPDQVLTTGNIDGASVESGDIVRVFGDADAFISFGGTDFEDGEGASAGVQLGRTDGIFIVAVADVMYISGTITRVEITKDV